jgi:hypothetical protein
MAPPNTCPNEHAMASLARPAAEVSGSVDESVQRGTCLWNKELADDADGRLSHFGRCTRA